MKQLLLLVLLLGLVSCPTPIPPAPPGPPHYDADPIACDGACVVIKAKCPKTKLAQKSDCADACKKVESSGYVTMHAPCISAAATAEDVRKCNFDCQE